MDIIFRKARKDDIPAINDIYDKILKEQEEGKFSIGWVWGIYPTEETAREALDQDELYVGEYQGKICGSAIINQKQLDIYKKVDWKYPAADDEVLVLHTLTIDPDLARRGLGQAFVRFYERLALEKACPYLRFDTNVINSRAQALYKKMGYEIVGREISVFNGIKNVTFLMLEKALDPPSYSNSPKDQ